MLFLVFGSGFYNTAFVIYASLVYRHNNARADLLDVLVAVCPSCYPGESHGAGTHTHNPVFACRYYDERWAAGGFYCRTQCCQLAKYSWRDLGLNFSSIKCPANKQKYFKRKRSDINKSARWKSSIGHLFLIKYSCATSKERRSGRRFAGCAYTKGYCPHLLKLLPDFAQYSR